MAETLAVNPRRIRYWKAGKHPVSMRYTAKIAALVRAKHGERMRRAWIGYLEMVAVLSDTQTKARLQMVDLNALRIDDQEPPHRHRRYASGVTQGATRATR
jgi:hypothetical protein